MGIHIVIALATIVLVWFGVQEALASAHGGAGFSMGRFLNLFMLLTFAYAMVNYYDTSIPRLGFSIKGFIDGGTINLMNVIGSDGSTNMLNEIHSASSKTGPSTLNSVMSPYYAIVYFVVQFLLAMLAAIISAILAYGAIAATIIGLLGPIFIPFLVVDKRLDEDNPRLQAQLPDGSRTAAWIPPLVSPAPAIAIRKFTSRNYTVDDLIARGTLTQPLAEFLAEQIRSAKTLLISGGTGTGKTTLLRILANSIPENERILVIEDTPELQIRKPNIVAVGSQTSTFKTNVSFDELLKDTLRFRPDRIILGEVRGIEARTLLDSFNTGHAGSLATIHANSAEKALRRFANLVMRSHAQTTFSDTEAEIGEAVDFVLHVERQSGRRIVREVLALRGYDRDAKRFLIEPVFEVQHAAA